MSTKIAILIAALTAAEADHRREAAEALGAEGEQAQEGAIGLVRAAGDEDEEVREAAVGALEGLGPPADGQIAELATLTQDANADVAYWAVTLLGRLGAAAEPAVPALIAALKPPAALAVRQRAAWAIGQVGSVAVAARPALAAAAADADPRLARLAQEALAQLQR